MKRSNDDIKEVRDEIVVDSRDVELAREIAMKKHPHDVRLEETIRITDDETLTSRPQ
ncbi:MAG: hypothetical protein HDT01_04750 [Bacteroidales bacterium]|nr:hypothetical protein [Bacteroidales bacterium]